MRENCVVHTVSGTIQGYVQANISVFKGIPYAEPPVGVNRFTTPQPVKPWQDILKAREYGPIAVQPPSPPEISKLNLPVSEPGCLTLNIWTPGLDNKKRPVLFWIHGGSLAIGSGAEYDGQKLAARGDVVVVTINYRLGIFGFLYVPGKAANNGLLDQIEALKWVKNNITQFGGDPTNITLFGESAGALSITVLMTMPKARGLFKRAILQSSACAPFNHKGNGGIEVGKRVFALLGIDYGNIDALRKMPSDQLLSVYREIELSTPPNEFMPPFVDGEIIPMHPLEAIKNGYANDIEIMAGFNSNEGALFSLWNPGIDSMTEQSLTHIIQWFVKMASGGGYDENITRKLIDYYLKTHRTYRRAWEEFFSDNMFIFPINRFLAAQSRYQPKVYCYEFSWKTPQMGGVLGTPHALDLYFIFDMFEKTPVGIFPARNVEVEKISHVMMDSWVNFARTGNPNHADIPKWQPYTEKQRSRMVFGKEMIVMEHHTDELDALWEKIM